jgi:hypothetical protein
LRSRAVGSQHGEMAVSTLGKAPFGAGFPHFFDDWTKRLRRGMGGALWRGHSYWDEVNPRNVLV